MDADLGLFGFVGSGLLVVGVRGNAMSADRTFAATHRKRTAARREGRVAKSSELVAAGSTLLALLVLYYFGSQIVIALANQMKSSLTNVSSGSLTLADATGQIGQMGLLIAAAVVPVLVVVACLPVVMHWLQFGFLFTPDVVRPRLGRVLPQSRPGGFLTPQTWMRGGLSLLKLTLVAGVVGFYLYRELPQLMRLLTLPVPALAVAVGRMIAGFGMMLAGVLLVPAVLDFLVARWQFSSELRMTQEEVREEQRMSGRR